MQVLRMSEEIIYPAASVHPPLYRLSETDQPYRHDMGILYFYKQGPPSSEALKSSLSKTLAFFYPLAGRLVERAEESVAANGGGGGAAASGAEEIRKGGAIVGRADVRCSDEGVLFCEAWTETRLDAYGRDFQPHPDFNLLRMWGHEHTFLLQVKVTYFSCGGVCLCVQGHHGVMDGASSAHFTKSWVEIANGAESPSVLPDLDHPPLEEMYRLQDLHNVEDYSSYQQPFPSSPTEEIPNKVFQFKPEFVESLKSEASHEEAGGKYSSFDCIVAYMSKCLALARGIPADEEVCISYPVNGRGRLEPPLPASYFGNAVFQTHASVTVRDLVEKPLSHTARHVRDATSKITDAHMRSVIDWSARQASPMPCITCSSQHLYFNSWTSFPLSDLDFGWGSPLCFRVRLIPSELVLLFPSSAGKGHLDVLVALKEDHMKNLHSLLSSMF